MTVPTANHDSAGYAAARTAAAVGRHGARGWLRVSGADAVSFLHGILTNDISSLQVGQWCYAAYLTPQGRMVSDMRVLRREGDVGIETEPQVQEMIAARFDASIFTERVQIATGEVWSSAAGPGAASAGAHSVIVCGPAARDTLASILGPDTRLGQTGVNEFSEVDRRGERLVLIGHQDLGVPALDAIGSPAACDALERDLLEAGAAPLGGRAIEALRIEAGTPRFGVDMTDDTIPLEAGIEGRAISMNKGCYVGQEVIIRILHRGHGRVARRLVGLTIEGTAVPPAGAPLAVGEREVGAITSAAFSPRLGCAIALGYVHRDFTEPGSAVTVRPAGAPARVVRLPFTPD